LTQNFCRFLLACLHVDSLRDKRTPRKVRATLDNLPKGSEALDRSYSEALTRIDGQLPEDRKLARRIISWLTYALRFLKTYELCEALAIEIEDEELYEDNRPDLNDIISVCAGLVTVDKETNIIRLVHYTTQEYFERICHEWNPDGQQEIVTTCLIYLALDIFRKNGEEYSELERHRMLNENIFLEYAANHWGEHLRPIQTTMDLTVILAFFENETWISRTAWAMDLDPQRRYELWPDNISGCHLCAWFGLDRLLVEFLALNPNYANMKDVNDRTPLSWAVEWGRQEVVHQLLACCNIDVNSKDKLGKTPLSLAADEGHEVIVQQLLERNDVDADPKDMYMMTPLSYAAKGGHIVIVRELLRRGDVHADSTDYRGSTPLSWAADGGHTAVVKLLMARNDVNINVKDQWLRTPLSWAVTYGHETTVQQLLTRSDINVNSKNCFGYTPLQSAVNRGQYGLVKQLLAWSDIDVNIENKWGHTALSMAAAEGYYGLVQLLLAHHDVNVNSKDKGGRTALDWAILKERKGVIKLLEEKQQRSTR
jgi:ankyrin repeat protein